MNDLTLFNYVVRYIEPHQAPRFTQEFHPEQNLTPTLDPVLNGLRSHKGLSLGEIIALLIAPLHEQGIRVTPMDERAYKVQSFARVHAGPRLDELSESFFLLRRVLRNPYEVARSGLEMDGGAPVSFFAGNVAIGVSLEGLAALVVDNSHPFMVEIGERMRRSYFAHYLLALHQRMALIDLAVTAGGLPPIMGRLPPRQLWTVRAVKNRAVGFNLHHRLTVVSSSTSHEGVYCQAIEVLSVPQLAREVREEVAELDDLLRTSLQEEETAHARHLNLVVAAFAVLSLLLGLFGMNPAPYGKAADNTDFYGSAYFWLPTSAAIILVLLVVIVFGRKQSI